MGVCRHLTSVQQHADLVFTLFTIGNRLFSQFGQQKHTQRTQYTHGVGHVTRKKMFKGKSLDLPYATCNLRMYLHRLHIFADSHQCLFSF